MSEPQTTDCYETCIDIGWCAGHLRCKLSSPQAAGYLLSKNELEALEEIGRKQVGIVFQPYWFRQASMQKLYRRGFVEPMPGYDMYKRPGWRITPAGREHLKGFPSND